MGSLLCFEVGRGARSRRSRPRTVMEVRRRQSTGRLSSRDVVAEVEEEVEEVLEGK